MHDIRSIRDNPAAFDQAMSRRFLPAAAAEILDTDRANRHALTRLQEVRNRRNSASKAIGRAKASGQDAADLIADVAALKGEMATLEAQTAELADTLRGQLAGLPNILDGDVPDGPDESANLLLRCVGEPRSAEGVPEHFEIGERLGLMDFAAAAKLSGSRFVVLSGQLARLHRALGQFMIDLHTRHHGLTEVDAPYLVRDAAAFGTGQLPKFGEDLFRTTSGHWLIPTAEVTLTNLVAGDIVAAADLPLRYTALTPCFRSEAGAAGRDTRGMLRQHQFTKCEMVTIATPDNSAAEHERMLGCAEAVLQKLELPYRVVVLCSGDTGFGARKTYDIEVWLPGQGLYREISSCSNCGDFQARRMNARFRDADGKKTRFLHTLNGSGVAVGRALIALLENHYRPDGTVAVPRALRPYLGGGELIEP